MTKYCLYSFLIILAYSTIYSSTDADKIEILPEKIILVNLRIASKKAYEVKEEKEITGEVEVLHDSTWSLCGHEGRGWYFQDKKGKSLKAKQTVLKDGANGIYGTIYSITGEKELDNKIFVAFRGSTSARSEDGLIHWVKNIFGSSFDHKEGFDSYYFSDVERLFVSSNFHNILKSHIKLLNQENQKKQVNEEELRKYEYYFVGHSRGGGLALLAAQKFQDEEVEEVKKKDEEAKGVKKKVKVVTFNSPRVAATHRAQILLVKKLGFNNIFHFENSFDFASRLPIHFVKNYGIKLKPPSPWSLSIREIFHTHEVPTKDKMLDFSKLTSHQSMFPYLLKRAKGAALGMALPACGGMGLLYWASKPSEKSQKDIKGFR